MEAEFLPRTCHSILDRISVNEMPIKLTETHICRYCGNSAVTSYVVAFGAPSTPKLPDKWRAIVNDRGAWIICDKHDIIIQTVADDGTVKTCRFAPQVPDGYGIGSPA